MPSLKDIRRRISSIKNTQQITKAMKLVAASRLRRAQMAIMSARPFAEKLESITDNIIAELALGAGVMDSDKKANFMSGLHPLLKPGTVEEGGRNKVAVIVISSDRGLCGAYNGAVSKFALKAVHELQANPANQVSTFFYGRKAYEFCSRRGIVGELTPNFWAGKFGPSKSDKVAARFTETFLKGEFNSIQVIFTQFKSIISQTPMMKQVLPLTLDTGKTLSQEPLGPPFIYEPGKEGVLAELLPTLVKTQFYRLFADSLASEFGAKMTAMDNATRNAGTMISKFTLEANRVRQASITKELMEIVGGAEALKG